MKYNLFISLVMEVIQRLPHARILAVHVRSTDLSKQLNIKHHPKNVSDFIVKRFQGE